MSTKVAQPLNLTKYFDDQCKLLLRQKWKMIHSEDSLGDPELSFPGVYLIAESDSLLEGKPISPDEIHYVGMSNSKGGVRKRLEQFKSGLQVTPEQRASAGGKHSAARHWVNHNGGKTYSGSGRRKFYFAATMIKRNKAPFQPSDLRVNGQVACLEYYLLAYLMEKRPAKDLPRWNCSDFGRNIAGAKVAEN